MNEALKNYPEQVENKQLKNKPETAKQMEERFLNDLSEFGKEIINKAPNSKEANKAIKEINEFGKEISETLNPQQTKEHLANLRFIIMSWQTTEQLQAQLETTTDPKEKRKLKTQIALLQQAYKHSNQVLQTI